MSHATDTSPPHNNQATSSTTITKPRQSHLRTLVGTGVGNALEWFDWNVYAAFAAYFATQVFNNDDPRSAFLKTMAVFAVGFVARPFGGVVFGWVGDHFGRKQALSAAVLSASLGSLIVAICPTYSQAGWLASALLLIGRLIQGLAHGGELPAAQTYLAEHAPREHRGLYSSAIYVTGTLGMLMGLALGLILQFLLTEDQMAAWGWRIPFAIGAALGVVALIIRNNMDESEVFEEAKSTRAAEPRPHVLVQVARNWRTGLKVILMTSGLTVAYYIWSVTMPAIAKTQFGFSQQDAFRASLVGNLVFILALPFWGWLSDKIGRRPTIITGLLGVAILYIPLFNLIAGGQLWQLITAIGIQLFLLSGFLGHAPATYAEMFDTEQRTAGFGIPYAIAIAAFGGTAGYVLTWMNNSYHFAIYSIILLVISSITVMTLPETKGKDLSH